MSLFKIVESVNDGTYGARIDDASIVYGGLRVRIMLVPFDLETGKEYAEIQDLINVTGGEYSKSAYFSNAVGEIDEAHELIGKNVEIDVKVNQSGERMYHNVVAYRPYTEEEFISISDEELEQLPFN